MKTNILKITFLLSFLLMMANVFGQAPQKFNYQGIARDTKGNPMKMQKLGIKLSVLPTADAMDAEYEETQVILTNEFGLYTLQIGNGTSLSGEMKDVKWETGNKYIKVAIDQSGGTNYKDVGTTQLLSVPYAIYADKAGMARETISGSSNNGTRSGTHNHLTKFDVTGANGVNSQIYDDGTKIGIGTVSPLGKVHSFVSTGDNLTILENSNSTGVTRMNFKANGNTNYCTIQKRGSGVAGDASVATMPLANLFSFGNNTGAMLLNSQGNMGIAPTINGVLQYKFLTDTLSGNVGLAGNSIPTARVHINNTQSTNANLRITNNTTGHLATDGLELANVGNVASITNRENSDLILGTNNTERVRITPFGFLGVGTATPSYQLDVKHGGSTGIRSQSSSSFSVVDIDANSGDAALRFQKAGVNQWNVRNRPGDDYFEIFELSGGGSRFVIQDATGNVGIGETTAPAYKLDVLHGGSTGIRSRSSNSFSVIDIDGFSGDAALRFQKAGVNQWNIRNNPGNNDLQIFELGGGGERMRIENTTGKVVVNGNFTALGVKAFTMDHPLDPENKILIHAAAESNEVINFYSGNAVTDANGKVTVQLPDYFEAINKDYRYQLTCIGSFAQAMVSKEVMNNTFEISTNQPNVKVSWEVKGVRNDARMKKFPFKAEEEKISSQKGKYLDPLVHDKQASLGTSYDANIESSLNDAKPSTQIEAMPVNVKGGSIE